MALVVCALAPYLALSTAMTPLEPILGRSLHLSQQSLALTTGMANAAYAFGEPPLAPVIVARQTPARRDLLRSD